MTILVASPNGAIIPIPEKFERLERLNLLLDEGRITPGEFKQLKNELFENEQGTTASTSTHPSDISSESQSPSSPRKDQDNTPMLGEPQSPVIRALVGNQQAGRSNGNQTTPRIYKLAFGAGVISVFLGGAFGLLAWATAALGVAALLSEQSRQRRWMAWLGLALGILFSFSNAYANGHLDSLLGDDVSEWSYSDVSAVVGYCDEKEAHTNCGSLADALRADGCAVSEAYNYVDDEANRLTRTVPPAGANGPFTRTSFARGILGTAGYCELQAIIRNS